MEANNLETYGVCEAVSVGSLPHEGEELKRGGGRSLTLLKRSDDPDDGWEVVDWLHGLDTVVLPDDVEDDEERGVAVGYEDDALYRVLVDGYRAVIERES